MTVQAARLRVLLIEPDADNRELYILGLTASGFDVVAVEDATAATFAVGSNPPAIVVTANRRAEPCAVALVRRWAEGGVPLIALTTAPASEHEALRAAGARFVLLKPYLPHQLAAVITEVLGWRLP
jgi:DNA-binding response OmpR family regulator